MRCCRAPQRLFSQQGWLLRGRACSGADPGVRERGQVPEGLRSRQCQGRPRLCGRKQSPRPPYTVGICPGSQSPALGCCDKHLSLLRC